MRPLPVIASLASLALLAGCTSTTTSPQTSSPAPIESAADEGAVVGQSVNAADVQGWDAGPVPGGDGSGPAYPTVWPASLITGSGTATSLTPVLAVPGNADLSGRVEVEVVDLGSGGGFPDEGDPVGLVLQTSGDAQRIEVPGETLQQGGSYLWRARGEGKWKGPWIFTVDTVRQQTAPVDTVSGLDVNLMSGVPSLSWSTPSVNGAMGPFAVGAVYRPGQPETPGLPAGWSWQLPGSGFTTLTESGLQSAEDNDPTLFGGDAGPLSVTLRTASGAGLTYVRTETGAYVPGLANGTPTQYALRGAVTRVEPGVWQFTTVEGTLVRFVNGRIATEWNGQQPVAEFEWDGEGRLIRVTDGVSRSISLVYQGQGDCPAQGWGNGFGVADGMWCAAISDSGNTSSVGYVSGQIGIIADSGGVSLGLGWDAAGRLSAVRGSAAQAAAATAGDAWRGPDMTTRLAYDGDGRVASVTAPAASPGGPSVRHEYAYPTGGGDELTATVTETGSAGSRDLLRVTATSDAWKVITSIGLGGLKSTNTYDDKTGVVAAGTDQHGRTIDMELQEGELMRSSVGPYVGSSDGALRTDRILDATINDPSAGAGSQKPWTGLSAMVWSDGVATPQWWDRQTLGEGSLGGRVGTDGPWTAQASGTWKVPQDGEWRLVPTTSDGLDLEIVIDGYRCSGSGTDPCTVPLRAGDHDVSLAMRGEGPQSFSVDAARGDSAARPVPLDDLRPDYGVDTLVATNDRVGSSTYGTTVSAYSRPWTSQADTISTAGDLRTAYAYEPADPAKRQWGRQTASTTPSGLDQLTSYYGDDESAQDPCTNASSPQAGLIRQITRTDGVTLDYVYDAAGRPVSVTTASGGTGERVCTSYDAAGRVLSTSTSTLDGKELTATSTTYTWSEGQLTTTATTTVSGETFTTTLVVDALDRPVSFTDAWGLRTDFAYDLEGRIVSRKTASSDGSALLDLQYAYDNAYGEWSSISANGTSLATVTYDDNGLVSAVDFAGGVAQSVAYDGSGNVSAMTIEGADRTFKQRRDRNDAGRTLGSVIEVSQGKKVISTSTWSYGYDRYGWLSDAVLKTDGDTAAVGGDKRTFAYGYGSTEACPTQQGLDTNRTSGSRDGTGYDTCYDDRGRLTWTTDPHLVGEGRAKATWDALGRLVSLDGTVPLELTWASGTQVASITQGGSTTEFLALGGALIRETLDGTATRYGFASPGDNAPTVVMDDAGAPRELLVGLPGGALARLDATAALQRIDHMDLFGSHLTTTDASGSAVGLGETRLAAAFGPYGEPLVERPAPTTRPDYAWQAAARNPSTAGWHDLTVSARPYHPWLGSFLAYDPEPGSSSTGYGYGNGTPLDSPDVTGEWGVWDTLAAVGLGLTVIARVASGKASDIKYLSELQWRGIISGVASVIAAVGAAGSFATNAYENNADSWASGTVSVLAVAGIAWNVYDFRNSYKSYAKYQAELAEESLTASVMSQPDVQDQLEESLFANIKKSNYDAEFSQRSRASSL